jgi:5-methylcytosine-specific restriction protein B
MQERGKWADKVRAYVGEKYITPARARNEPEVSIRVGDVHTALGFKGRLPLVCSALGAQRFQDENNVKLLGTTGPYNTSITIFRYRLL